MIDRTRNTLILTGQHVSDIVERFGLDPLMDLLIERLALAIAGYQPEKTEIPVRSGFNYLSENPGLIEWMPVHCKDREVVIKVVGYHPKNPAAFSLPTILSSIYAYDTGSGHLKGIADGVLLTALRTGAASAVASRYMANPSSTVLGLIGCGAQSVTQLHALSREFSFKQVLIYDKEEDVMQSFRDRISMLQLNLDIIPSDMEHIMLTSDIVCTGTSIGVGEGPLFKGIRSNPHIHINAIGSDFPGKTELPPELLRQAVVCPDFLEQAVIEGECQQLRPEEIGPDWVTLIQNYHAYPDIRNSRSVFDSTGWALEDQVVMQLFMELAEKFNIGLEVALENISADAKNPYHFLYSELVPTRH